MQLVMEVTLPNHLNRVTYVEEKSQLYKLKEVVYQENEIGKYSLS